MSVRLLAAAAAAAAGAWLYSWYCKSRNNDLTVECLTYFERLASSMCEQLSSWLAMLFLALKTPLSLLSPAAQLQKREPLSVFDLVMLY
jgi:hypothetical protein